MSLKTRASNIIADFDFFNSWEEKYEHLISLGRELPELKKEFKTDAHLINGCQSKVWLHCVCKNKKLYFYADSDALITKGLVALVLQLYSGVGANEILSSDIDVFSKIGLRSHLSMNRANGLKIMLNTVQNYSLKYYNE
mgnify:CR=1 FL=1